MVAGVWCRRDGRAGSDEHGTSTWGYAYLGDTSGIRLVLRLDLGKEFHPLTEQGRTVRD
ncbi:MULTISPECIES: hypothetical protein [Streptomyces]|uniref:hypothetical protein n=1 Tax=Streptomyces TaxID=1883 RepID=UPI0013312EF0|nr:MULTISPECIES: hypothetical protein [Streptomyces]